MVMRWTDMGLRHLSHVCLVYLLACNLSRPLRLRPPIPVVACCVLLRLAATVLIHTTLLALLAASGRHRAALHG